MSKDDLKLSGLIFNGYCLPYNPKFKERARILRENQTAAEKKLWKEVLSRKQFRNLRWLRQRPINHYIVDFYCPEIKCVIEVDGESHSGKEVYDLQRTILIESYGIQVIRFKNDEILKNIQGVYEQLSNSIPPFNKGG